MPSSFYRLLLDDAAVESGAVTDATEPVADDAVETPVETVPKSDFEALQKRLNELEKADKTRKAAEAEAAKKAKSERDAALKEKGEWETLAKTREQELADRETRLGELDSRFKTSERRREVAIALGGFEFVSVAAAKQAAKEIEALVDVEADGEGFKVIGKDGRDLKTLTTAFLNSEDGLHFLKAKSRGGSGADGSRPSKTGVDESTSDYLSIVAAEVQKQIDSASNIGLRGKPKK